MIVPRQPAPALSVPLLSGDHFTLAERRPGNFTILAFNRGKHCPICKGYLTQVQDQLERAESMGAEIAAFSMDSEERARASATDWELGRLAIGYALPERTARDWGLYISSARPGTQEPAVFSEPGLFVIRPDMTVFFAQTQSAPFTRPPIDQLLNGLDFVLKNDYPPRGDLTRAA